MTLKEIFFALSILFFFYYTIIYLELFARKEYRLDRLRAHIKDFGLLEFFWPSELRRPKIVHPRNILICSLVFIIFFAFLFFVGFNIWISILFFSAAPITSFSVVALAVFITSLPVLTYRKYITNLAAQRVKKYNPFVIGVTGSYGKSTTKTYIAHVLSKKFKVLETPKNTNTDIGIALFILRNLHLTNTVFVAEMGAYKKGEIEKICEMTKPKMGVITSFGTQHTSIFGSPEKIIESKCELALALPKDGMLFLPLDEKKKISEEIISKLNAPIKTYKTVPLDANLQAIQAAVSVAANLGMTYDAIQNSIESIPKPENLKVKKHVTHGYELILSPYSTNTEGFIGHLSMLKKLKNPQKIVVTPGIIELGSEKYSEYLKIAKKIPKNAHLFTTDFFLASICESEKINVTFERLQKKLFKRLRLLLSADCALLIEGRFQKEFIDTIA